jgi:hypothetical protein
MEKVYGAALAYDDINDKYGLDRANRWAFGYWNPKTGKREGANAAFLGTYWAANGDPERAQQSLDYMENRDIQRIATDTKSEHWDSVGQKRNDASPYLDEFGMAKDVLTKTLIRAAEMGDNGEPNYILVEDAWNTYYDTVGRISDRAKDAGVPLDTGGSWPSHGTTFYEIKGTDSGTIINPEGPLKGEQTYIYIRGGAGLKREDGIVRDYSLTVPPSSDPVARQLSITDGKVTRRQGAPTMVVTERNVRDTAYDQRTFQNTIINANEALDEVDHYETTQRQQGFILDLVAEQFDMPDREDYQMRDKEGNVMRDERGFILYDDDLYEKETEAARQEAAKQAPQIARQLIKEIRDDGHTVFVGSITWVADI